jgi:hypothetical protein
MNETRAGSKSSQQTAGGMNKRRGFQIQKSFHFTKLDATYLYNTVRNQADKQDVQKILPVKNPGVLDNLWQQHISTVET